MKREVPPSYYETLFTENNAFNVHYKESFYYVAWTQVIFFLKKVNSAKILEIGCGTGQFAEYLKDQGFLDYKGFDFAQKAIEMAQTRVDANFYCGDALDKKLYEQEFTVVICLEVLEHIKEDYKVLNNIPIGRDIIFSVPNFDDPSHVRWFTSERQVKKRYLKYIDIKQIVQIGNLYICRGLVKPFKPSLLQSLLATREDIRFSSFIIRLRHIIKNRLKLKSL